MQSLPTRVVNFTHMSIFRENHGDEIVHGVALKCSFDASNALLDEFEDGLRASLYRAANDDDPRDLPFEDMPVLRFPKVTSFPWAGQLVGRQIVIAYGIKEDGFLRFVDSVADNFAFTLKEGGSITVNFRVKVHPNGEQVGKLFELVGGEVDLSISAPSASPQQEIDYSDDDPDAANDDRAFPGAIDGTGADFPRAAEGA